MTLPIDKATSVWTKLSRRLWTPTVIGLLLVHTAFLYYVTLGLPGAGPMVPERLFGEWRAVAKKVDEVAGTVEAEIGSMPVIVGMDKNFISSELSFYCSNRIVGTRNIGGVHFFDQPSLMWARWYPRSAAAGKDLLMIDLSRKRLTSPRLAAHFTSLGNISMENLQYNGRVIGTLYWRVGRGYKG
jgi:dolichol-phosphate mannosyltransferase